MARCGVACAALLVGGAWAAAPQIEQVHLASSETFDSAVVAFATATLAGKPFVEFRVDPSSSLRRADGVWFNFTEGNPKGVQNVYKVELQGLPARTRVHYKACVETESQPSCSTEFSFVTLAQGEDWDPMIMYYGDLGHSGPKLVQRFLTALPGITKEVQAGKIDAILHMGDFAYDMHDDGGQRGDEFMRRIEPVAASVFYQTVPGNHEIIDGSFAHYRGRFFMPHKEELNDYRMWWSMNLGKIHLVAVSTEVFFGRPAAETAAMLQWLEADLAEANKNRAAQPWVVTIGHRPPYCSNVDHDCLVKGSEGERVRMELETIMYQAKVDVALWAHEHSYERTWPVYNYTVTQKNYHNAAAPVHIISGAAGCNEGAGLCLNPIFLPLGDWSAYRTWGVFHPYSYGHLRAPNATHLYVDQVDGVAGNTFDSVWITKDARRPSHDEATILF